MFNNSFRRIRLSLCAKSLCVIGVFSSLIVITYLKKPSLDRVFCRPPRTKPPLNSSQDANDNNLTSPFVEFNGIYIYSAFNSERANRITLVGFMSRAKPRPHNLRCRFYGKDGETIESESPRDSRMTVEGRIDLMHENHERESLYLAVTATCDLPPSTAQSRIHSVALVDGNLDEEVGTKKSARTRLVSSVPIGRAQDGVQHKELVVCVRPLFGPYDSVAELAQFVAFYRANGATRFLFYVLSVSDRVRRLLARMSEFAQVLDFRLPIDRSQIHAEGQLVANHDCLHRYSESPIVFVDIDEMIVIRRPAETRPEGMAPKEGPGSLSAVVEEVQSTDDSAVALMFRMALVCNELNRASQLANLVEEKGDEKSEEKSRKRSDKSEVMAPVQILTATRRQATPWPFEWRSKVVVLRPWLVVDVGVHSVWRLSELADKLPGAHTVRVPPEDGLLFHYRDCCGLRQPYFFGLFSFSPFDDETVEDRGVHRWARSIWRYYHQFSRNT